MGHTSLRGPYLLALARPVLFPTCHAQLSGPIPRVTLESSPPTRGPLANPDHSAFKTPQARQLPAITPSSAVARSLGSLLLPGAPSAFPLHRAKCSLESACPIPWVCFVLCRGFDRGALLKTPRLSSRLLPGPTLVPPLFYPGTLAVS